MFARVSAIVSAVSLILAVSATLAAAGTATAGTNPFSRGPFYVNPTYQVRPTALHLPQPQPDRVSDCVKASIRVIAPTLGLRHAGVDSTYQWQLPCLPWLQFTAVPTGTFSCFTTVLPHSLSLTPSSGLHCRPRSPRRSPPARRRWPAPICAPCRPLRPPSGSTRNPRFSARIQRARTRWPRCWRTRPNMRRCRRWSSLSSTICRIATARRTRRTARFAARTMYALRVTVPTAVMLVSARESRADAIASSDYQKSIELRQRRSPASEICCLRFDYIYCTVYVDPSCFLPVCSTKEHC
jgi:hypothetical protein